MHQGAHRALGSPGYIPYYIKCSISLSYMTNLLWMESLPRESRATHMPKPFTHAIFSYFLNHMSSLVEEAKEPGLVTSRLIVEAADQTDTGNYSCSSDAGHSNSTAIHVITGKPVSCLPYSVFFLYSRVSKTLGEMRRWHAIFGRSRQSEACLMTYYCATWIWMIWIVFSMQSLLSWILIMNAF